MKNPFKLPRRANLSRPWRWLVPVLLVLLFLAVLFWLPWQARQMESTERQEQLIADTLWVEQTLRFELARSEEALAALGADLVAKPPAPDVLRARFEQMFKNGHELRGVLWLGEDASRPMAERGKAFLETYCKKARYVDVADLTLPGVPPAMRKDLSPIVVGALANRLAQHYEAVRGHDLETRRYMFKVDY